MNGCAWGNETERANFYMEEYTAMQNKIKRIETERDRFKAMVEAAEKCCAQIDNALGDMKLGAPAADMRHALCEIGGALMDWRAAIGEAQPSESGPQEGANT